MNFYQTLTQEQHQTISQQMLQSLHVLSMDACDLTEFLYRQQEENPLLEIAAFPQQWSAPVFSRSTKAPTTPAEPGSLLELAPVQTDFRDALLEELNLLHLQRHVLQGAKLIVSDLDDAGYFRSSLYDIAQIAQISAADAARALEAVQSLDPPGIGARDLPEFFCLQLRRQGVVDPILYQIVQLHLHDAARKNYDKIAQSLQISQQAARQYVRQVLSLQPKLNLDTVCPEYVVPDAIVLKSGEKLEVQFNDRCIPKLQLSASYLALAASDASAAKYMEIYKKSANQVLYDTQMRQSTILRVITQIVSVQRAFFLSYAPLEALSLQDLSDALQLHPSTISKTISGKYLYCEYGTFPLKFFLSRKISTPRQDVSTSAIKRALRQLIAQQPELSDNMLCQKLSEQGLHIARRTAAKYRAEMGLSASFSRRRKRDETM